MRIQEYNPNLQEIAERVMLGPQAEIQRALETFNSRYGSDFGITPTFRWKPGTGNKLYDMYKSSVITNMRYSGIYQFFRRIDNRSWVYSNMKSALNNIEDMCKEMRSQRLRFQDNSDIVVDGWNEITESIQNQLEETHDLWPHTDMMIEIDVESNPDGHPEDDVVMFTFTMSNPMMKIISDDVEICEIKLYPVSVRFTKTILELITSKVGGGRRRTYNYQNPIAKAQYLDPGGLNHPYITHRYGNNDNGWNNVCFGAMQDDILNTVSDVNLIGTALHLFNWTNRFSIQHTHPHNPPWKSFYGMPKLVIDNLETNESYNTFVNIYNWHDMLNQCGVPNAINDLPEQQREYAINMDNTCNNIECHFRDDCTYYNRVVQANEERTNNVMFLSRKTPYLALFEHRGNSDDNIRSQVSEILHNDREEVEAHADEDLSPEARTLQWMESRIINRERSNR